MEGSTARTEDARASGLKALIAILYVMIFLVLFAGVFDRPHVDKSEGSHPAARESADLSQTLLGVNTLKIEPQGGAVTHAVSGERAAAEDLLPGDILLGRCRLSLVPSLNPHNGWTHVALYAGKGRLIVAGNPGSGVIERDVASWAYPEMTWVAYVRVSSTDDATRKRAVEFARGEKGRPYDLNWLSKQADGDSWYCSELIWAAYLHASGGSIDLERGPGWFGISPDDIFMNDETVVVGGHFEAKPDTTFSLLLKALAICILAGGGGIFVPHPIFSGARRRR
jgi:hypothetical protein